MSPPPPGFVPRPYTPQPNHYTDWATSALSLCKDGVWMDCEGNWVWRRRVDSRAFMPAQWRLLTTLLLSVMVASCSTITSNCVCTATHEWDITVLNWTGTSGHSMPGLGASHRPTVARVHKPSSKNVVRKTIMYRGSKSLGRGNWRCSHATTVPAKVTHRLPGSALVRFRN